MLSGQVLSVIRQNINSYPFCFQTTEHHHSNHFFAIENITPHSTDHINTLCNCDCYFPTNTANPYVIWLIIYLKVWTISKCSQSCILKGKNTQQITTVLCCRLLGSAEHRYSNVESRMFKPKKYNFSLKKKEISSYLQ